MPNEKLDKKYAILIAVTAVVLLLVGGFFVYRHFNTDDAGASAGNNDPGKTPAVSPNNPGSVKTNGVTHLGGPNANPSKPGTVPGKPKVVYTDAQVMAVLKLLLGPLPKGYTSTVAGREVRGGVEYYKVNVTNTKNSTLTYYVLPWESKAYMVDPQNNSLLPVVMAK